MLLAVLNGAALPVLLTDTSEIQRRRCHLTGLRTGTSLAPGSGAVTRSNRAIAIPPVVALQGSSDMSREMSRIDPDMERQFRGFFRSPSPFSVAQNLGGGEIAQ